MVAVPDPRVARVAQFCATVVAGGSPQLVECRPLVGKPANECFGIVEEHVAANGGRQVTGWAIWEFPGVFIEAEFHAVWQRPDGQLVDLTPRSLHSPAIVFVQDAERKYEARQVDNIREPLVRDNDVIRFLYLFRRRFEILNQGDLADQHGAVRLAPKAAREMKALNKEMTKLERRLHTRYATTRTDRG